MNKLYLLVLSVFLMSSTGLQQKKKENFEQKKKEAFAYCKSNNLDTNVCILIDMSVHSGKNRLFVVDFKADTLLLKGVCAHGSCDGGSAPKRTNSGVQFSNVPGSYCSSIGKYKMGKRSWSNWGINVHYKLHGLDPTNNNAYKRIVVLHSYQGVPNHEVYPSRVMTSLGCPMVSDQDMRYLDKLLKKRKNMLMWIYN
ncbi:MAG: hypothetical protein ACJA0Q_001988 [Saprospiraceae bacterium]|jgi:hypothetical protein